MRHASIGLCQMLEQRDGIARLEETAHQIEGQIQLQPRGKTVPIALHHGPRVLRCRGIGCAHTDAYNRSCTTCTMRRWTSSMEPSLSIATTRKGSRAAICRYWSNTRR